MFKSFVTIVNGKKYIFETDLHIKNSNQILDNLFNDSFSKEETLKEISMIFNINPIFIIKSNLFNDHYHYHYYIIKEKTFVLEKFDFFDTYLEFLVEEERDLLEIKIYTM